ncbi:MAG: 3'-5' exoribonuclease YhaM family protein, partial [Solirubrobacterales bacterium]
CAGNQQNSDSPHLTLWHSVFSERSCVGELPHGQQVHGVFAVRERERRTKRDGGQWLRLVLADRTGAVEAISWDDVDLHYGCCEPGAVVDVRGRFSVHPRYGSKITIDELRTVEPGAYDPEELSPAGPVPLDRMEQDLRALLATIQSPWLAELLGRFLDPSSDTWPLYRDAPAAKYYHQAYRHGLLEHSLSVAQAVSAAASFFPGLDREVAVTGALLHDIGKLEAYDPDPLAIDLTDAGRLEGEIPLGYYRIRREIESIDGFPAEVGQAVLHIILSHHGTLEHGSPVVPCTREATLVHAMDNLGGKLGSFDRIERELPDGESWSRFDRGIDAAAYFGRSAAA